MSLRTSRASSETWEEDLNQRLLALRSPPVTSHCAASVNVTRAAEPRLLPRVFEETNDPPMSRPFIAPFVTPPTHLAMTPLLPSTLDPLSNTGSESCSIILPFLVVDDLASSRITRPHMSVHYTSISHPVPSSSSASSFQISPENSPDWSCPVTSDQSTSLSLFSAGKPCSLF